MADVQFILSEYLEAAMATAQLERVDRSTICGSIELCPGVVAFAQTEPACREQLRSVLEEWVLVGLKLHHPIPVIAGIDLNQQPRYEPEAV